MSRVTIKTNGQSEKTATEVGEGSPWAHPIRALRHKLHWGEPSIADLPVTGFVPDFDVRETADAFILQADVPGVESRDLEVRIASNRLTVTGARAPESVGRGETLHVGQRFWGAFSRSVMLPSGVDTDRLEATLEHGVLTVTIPKLPEARTRRIPVKG